MNLLQTVKDVLRSSRALDAMERGPNAVLHVIADVLDSWIAVNVPVYGAAKNACASVPNCTERLVRMRDDAFMEIAAQTGIYAMVATACRIYNALPKEIRVLATQGIAVAADAVTIGVTAFEAVAELDVEKGLEALTCGVGFVAESPMTAIAWGQSGADMVRSVHTRYLSDVWDVAEDIPGLGSVVEGVHELEQLAGYVEDVIVDAVEAGLKSAYDWSAEAGVDVYDWTTSAMVDAGGVAMTLVGNLGSMVGKLNPLSWV